MVERKRRIVARTVDEVDISPVDFYSIGHVIMGMLSFFFSSLVTLPFLEDWREISVITSILVAWGWEMLENGLLVDTKLKFHQRQDSLFNSQMDVFFCTVGALAGVVFSLSGSMLLFLVFVANTSISLFVGYKLWKRKVCRIGSVKSM